MQEELAKLTADELKRRCHRYREEEDRAKQADNQYCFEIFRRAIVENDQACWSIMYKDYEMLIQKWLHDSIEDDYIGDAHISDLVVRVFEKHWRFFDQSHLAAAKNLCSLMAYLKSCAMTCLQEERRRLIAEEKRARREEEYSSELFQPSKVEEGMLHKEFLDLLWQEILSCCNREPPEQFRKEKLIAWLVYKNDLKPSRIYAEHPDTFTDVDEIYDLKRKLFARLRNRPTLRHIWEERFS